MTKQAESTNTEPGPSVASIAPPTEGPSTREPWRVMPASATALSRCSFGTTFAIRACSDGVPKARAVPPSAANASTCHGSTKPGIVIAARPNAEMMLTASAAIAMRRRSARSASAPPIGPASSSGIMPANVTAPTHRA